MTDSIYTSLLKAQTAMMGAKKNGLNPHFHSNFSTLNDVWEAAKEPLHSNGLVLLQPIDIVNGQQVIRTIIFNAGGERIESICPIVCVKQNDPQALGSAITYARRYSLASIIGIVTDVDDDAEKAMARNNNAPKPQQNKPQEKTYQLVGAKGNHTYSQWLKEFERVANGCQSIDAMQSHNINQINAVTKDHPEAVELIKFMVEKKKEVEAKAAKENPPSPAAKAV